MPKKRESRGAALVEAAVVFPLLFLILFGIIQYGFMFAAHVTLRSAAVTAARAAVLDGADSGAIEQSARDAAASMLDPSLLSVAISHPTVGGRAATRVSLSYDLRLLVPFVVPGNNNGHLTLHAASTMR
jgi:Flp pilus assembly protein TadG